jgi:DNA polymerase-3 subunit gamma/tau
MLFDEILDKGFDGHNFINGLASHFRDLLVCKDEVTLQLLEVGANIREQYKTQAKKCVPSFILEALTICSQCDIQYKASKNQRLHVELALIQLSNIDPEKKKPDLDQAEPASVTAKHSVSISKPQPEPVVPPAETSVKKETKIQAVNAPSFSIKDALKAGNQKSSVETLKNRALEVEEALPVYEVTEVKPFTQEQLAQAWEKFALRYKDSEPRMFSTLSAVPPILKENYLIEFTLNNPLQEEEVLKLKPVLVNFLCKELSNNKIELTPKVSETVQGDKRFYTDKEKFDYMAEKNPDLLKFKQQFGLDFG